MELSKQQIKKISRRILTSRMRILTKNGFFGLLLMHMKIGLDESINTATANHERIIFNPNYVQTISDIELDYCLMHLVMHVALKHCNRLGNYEDETFWEACDIVINSMILSGSGNDLSSIYLEDYGGVQMHTVPNGREGYQYSVEEVYEMIYNENNKSEVYSKNDESISSDDYCQDENLMGISNRSWDDHSRLINETSLEAAIWDGYIESAAQAVKNQSAVKECGFLPGFIERYLKELSNPKIDWREELADFIKEEVCDYSFMPPDKRLSESPFYLPDYNDTEINVKNILFMIDASGSMSDSEITECFSEIKGAIDQFDGRLSGWLGFFDSIVYPPVLFDDINSIMNIRPKGGGGTNFHIIFDYVKKEMSEEPPVSVIILTDGYASFPQENPLLDIPVLWVVNNNTISVPWGMVARLTQ